MGFDDPFWNPLSGGIPTFFYGWCLPCCAAGEIAKATPGGNYFLSCCLVPCCCPCFGPCLAANDRERLSVFHPTKAHANNWLFSCLGFCCGCGCCLQIQELSTITHDRTFGQVIESAVGSIGKALEDATGPKITAAITANIALAQKSMK